jgi:hypothetical protein
LTILTCIHFCQCTQLGVRAKDQIDTTSGPKKFSATKFNPLIQTRPVLISSTWY